METTLMKIYFDNQAFIMLLARAGLLEIPLSYHSMYKWTVERDDKIHGNYSECFSYFTESHNQR